jgi:hypothetical protein
MLIKKKNTIPHKFVKMTIEADRRRYDSFYIIDKNIIIDGYWDAGRLKKALKVRIVDSHNLGMLSDLNNYQDIRRLTLETDKRKVIISELELTRQPRQRYVGQYYEFTVFGQTEILKWDK